MQKFEPEAFRALVEAQRAYRQIAESLRADHIAPIIAELQRNTRWIAEYQSNFAKMQSIRTDSAMQSAIEQFRRASDTSAISQVLQQFDESPIRDLVRQVNENVRWIRPELLSRFAETAASGSALSELSATLRSMDRSSIAQTLDALARNTPPQTLADLDALVDEGVLAGIGSDFDALLDAIDPSQDAGNESTPVRLSAQQEIWLGLIMLTLIWLLTMSEPESGAARELHNLAAGIIASVFAWSLVRRAGDRDE